MSDDFFDAPTGASNVLTLHGRLESKLDELTEADQERALRLLADWMACGTEERVAVSQVARLLTRVR